MIIMMMRMSWNMMRRNLKGTRTELTEDDI